jgi:CRP/FNR family transcriptional regulator, cyclic AMP receptor protein
MTSKRLKVQRNSQTSNAWPTESAERRFGAQSLFKYFPTLEPDKLERLAKAMSLARFKRGHRVLGDLQSRTDILLVLRGAIAVSWGRNGGHQVLVTLLAPGEMFGVSSSLPPELACGLRGYAFTNSLIATIDSRKLLDILLGVDLEAFKSATEMTMGWSFNTLMRYIKMFRMLPRDRLVIALIEMGAKFGVRDSRGLVLDLPLTQNDLANLLGASRQKVNADLGKLVREGAVVNLRRPIVLVPEKLFALIDPPNKHFAAQAK